jgi:hypothetical protein
VHTATIAAALQCQNLTLWIVQAERQKKGKNPNSKLALDPDHIRQLCTSFHIYWNWPTVSGLQTLKIMIEKAFEKA